MSTYKKPEISLTGYEAVAAMIGSLIAYIAVTLIFTAFSAWIIGLLIRNSLWADYPFSIWQTMVALFVIQMATFRVPTVKRG